MSKEWLVFGAGSFSHLVANLLIESGEQVTSFIVDDKYINTLEADLPVNEVSRLDKIFSTDKYKLLIGLGYTDINAIRRDRFEFVKKLGYQVGSVISPHACVLSDTEIKENVLIFEQAIIQPHVKLGRNIIIRAGANIGHHSVVGDNCFIASGVVTGGNVTFGDSCFIGLGAVIRDNITIADRSFIAAGAVVVKDTEPDSVYIGNPAKRIEKSSMKVTNG